jgi:hypothetical protein
MTPAFLEKFGMNSLRVCQKAKGLRTLERNGLRCDVLPRNSASLS